jgi:transcriptional antiterminator RfaH
MGQQSWTRGLAQNDEESAPWPDATSGWVAADRGKATGQQWYALETKPHKERAVHLRLLQKGILAYLPCIPGSYTPYFPGYVFVSADLSQTGLSLFNWLPGSKGLVQFGEQPTAVPDTVITSLKKHLTNTPTEVNPTFHHGAPVKIVDGPLAGYTALFDRYLSGQARVQLLLSLLGTEGRLVTLVASSVATLQP